MFTIEHVIDNFYDVYRDGDYVGQISRTIVSRLDGKDYWTKSSTGVVLGGASSFLAALQILVDTLEVCKFVEPS